MPGLTLATTLTVALLRIDEGDTPKSAVSLFHGSWLDPARGSAPVSWGFNPRICALFPVICEYYANTATRNDSFFSHSSGYMNVWESKEAPFSRFAQQTIDLVDDRKIVILSRFVRCPSR